MAAELMMILVVVLFLLFFSKNTFSDTGIYPQVVV